MFFDTDRLRKDIDRLYILLSKEDGGLPDDWWWWDKKKERILELSEEDENLLEDIETVFQHAKTLKKRKLAADIARRATELRIHLQKIQQELAQEDPLTLEMQRDQKDILARIIHKLTDDFRKFERLSDNDFLILTKFLRKHTISKGMHVEFVFYRAEHLAEQPQLNEDSSGQFGKGVYFTVDKEIAKRFRSKPSTLFRLAVRPKEFIDNLKPIFISKEDVKPFETRDPLVFQEHLRELGYGETSACVIGPIPEMGYANQILIDKDTLDEMIEHNIIHVEKDEDFNV